MTATDISILGDIEDDKIYKIELLDNRKTPANDRVFESRVAIGRDAVAEALAEIVESWMISASNDNDQIIDGIASMQTVVNALTPVAKLPGVQEQITKAETYLAELNRMMAVRDAVLDIVLWGKRPVSADTPVSNEKVAHVFGDNEPNVLNLLLAFLVDLDNITFLITAQSNI